MTRHGAEYSGDVLVADLAWKIEFLALLKDIGREFLDHLGARKV
jgi:hypothetical protein